MLTSEESNCATPQNWHLHLENCENITVKNLVIQGHANANDDGIDLNSCRNVLIDSCTVDVGDDALVFKTKGAAQTSNVLVKNSTFASEIRCIQFGSETEGDMRHIKILNCKLQPTAPRSEWPEEDAKPISKLIKRSQGAAISINTNDGATIEDVLIRDIQIDSVASVFHLHSARRMWKYSTGERDTSRPTGTLKNIRLENIQARAIPNTANPTIMGTPEQPLQDIQLKNISIDYIGSYKHSQQLDTLENQFEHCAWPGYWGKKKHYPASALEARYVHGLKAEQMDVSHQKPDPRPLFKISYCQDVDTLKAWKEAPQPK